MANRQKNPDAGSYEGSNPVWYIGMHGPFKTAAEADAWLKHREEAREGYERARKSAARKRAAH